MNEDIATIEAATPLARGHELILAQMERVAKVAEKAMDRGDCQGISFSSQAMQCLHSELRKSVFVPHYVTGTPFTPYYSTSGGEVIALTDENLRGLCLRMVSMALEANRTREASYSMYQLQGAEIALECLGIPHNVNFDPDIGKRTSVTVCGITMNVE